MRVSPLQAVAVLLLSVDIGGGAVDSVGYDGKDHNYYPHHAHQLGHFMHRATPHMVNLRHPELGNGKEDTRSSVPAAVISSPVTMARVLANVAKVHAQGDHRELDSDSDSSMGARDRKMVERLGRLVKRAVSSEDEASARDAWHELDEMEGIVVLQGKNAGPEHVDDGPMNAINAFRAEMCVSRLVGSMLYYECEDFMKGYCKRYLEGGMDGTEQNYEFMEKHCGEFFKDKKPPPTTPITTTTITPAPAPAPERKEVKEEEPAPTPVKEEEPEPAPAPAPPPPPPPLAPAPAGAPALETQALPEQGFEGPKVEHNDMKTATGDWRKEFGPQGPDQSYRSICAKHPENEWCIRNGHVGAAFPAAQSSSFLAFLLPSCVVLLFMSQLA